MFVMMTLYHKWASNPNYSSMLLVKGNPPLSGVNAAPVITTVNCTNYEHCCLIALILVRVSSEETFPT